MIEFTVEGPGEIVATDNGDPTDMASFALHKRKVFNGLALAIIRSKPGVTGTIKVKAVSPGLKMAVLEIEGI
jgi:beta-galactosidase